jgi:hypothetical protein
MIGNEIDDLLPFQTLNVKIHNLGQNPIYYYFKFMNQKEEDAMRGQMENLLVQNFTKSYSEKEQEQLKEKMFALAKSNFEAEVRNFYRGLSEYPDDKWEDTVSKPVIHGLANRLDVVVGNKTDTVDAIRKFVQQTGLLYKHLGNPLYVDKINPFPMNVVRHVAKRESIEFNESTPHDSLLTMLQVNFKERVMNETL